MAQFAIGAGKNIHLNCKKHHQHATDEILGKDRNPKGSGKSQTTQHNTRMQTITGNTYPVKDSLKALGGKWNKLAKGWDVPDEAADEARALVSGAPSRSISHSYDKTTFYRMNSGAVIYRNRSGMCEDAPCCGCCGTDSH